MSNSNKVFGGALLVAGTAIGAGVLAVPVLTAVGGFIPTLILYLISWLFSIASGFCFLEVMTWFKDRQQINMLSMARYTLGDVCKVLISLLYLFLFYSLLVAYFCEGGNILFRIFGPNVHWIRNLSPLSFAVIICPILMLKTRVIDYSNRVCVLGMGLAFLCFCIMGFTRIDVCLLSRSSWMSSIDGLPILFLSFGFQNVVPTLYYYMDKKVADVKKAIVLGSVTALIFYIVWEIIVLGTVPLSYLIEANSLGYTAVGALKNTLQNPLVYLAGEFFGFFALVSSFIGVALGMMDFLADAFGWCKRKHKFSIFFLAIIIPLAWSMCYPEIVVKCLNYAGGIGVALITGIFPVIMIWKGRYSKKHYNAKHLVPGGKVVLLFMFIIALTNIVTLCF
ncbi:tryptophan/tyrosine permease family protein [Chlamydia ibidis]|uniref:Tryptophan/tyrosine permease family protein n=2 Tax=Chlamydia ibidis TaxID=1405396 RepID=S7KFC4_9CHLA|nr:aromatic amino acid transport family protein [Chlamydia ibidis]EPP34876.1 tryptophan/tyrosine permease family protein [Chlamydia ibidis]EQM62323.1 tryptophan/tyrosine permease family protein [Chlamydia ibidis 10-1398/6]